ncbi:MAG: signal peptidase II [Dehalococcoidia bacterium]|tara:strand:+ start:3937 stop:4413 length:477 start_codon:yes stop_codon:yes gene_type:complete
MNIFNKNTLTAICVIATVLVLDQFTKLLVRQSLVRGESFPEVGFFRFTHVYNTGSLFGIFQGYNTPLIIASIVAILLLIWIYRTYAHKGLLISLALGLQLGGAAGNLIDRLMQGHVTDFLDVWIWPVFNIADSSIVIGLGILFFIMVTDKELRQEKNE